MHPGLWLFLLIVLFVAGGLFTFYRDSKRPLPKNLPPPLQDDPDELDDNDTRH